MVIYEEYIRFEQERNALYWQHIRAQTTEQTGRPDLILVERIRLSVDCKGKSGFWVFLVWQARALEEAAIELTPD